MSGDGHDTSCTYQKCAHPESSKPCPFVRDARPDDPELPKYIPGDTILYYEGGVLRAEPIIEAWQTNGEWWYRTVMDRIVAQGLVKKSITTSNGSLWHNRPGLSVTNYHD